jgi:hypothetical protein
MELEAKLLEVKAANGGGELLVVETEIEGAEVLAFRVPKAGEWKRYRAEQSDPNPVIKSSAATPLVHACCVYPDAATFQRLVDGRPGLVETCIGELIEFAGANSAKKVRKL